MKRNICDACENCVFSSRDIDFCMAHCDMVKNIIEDIEYKRFKCMAGSVYGSLKYFNPAEDPKEDPLPFE